MERIISLKKAIEISKKLQKEGKSISLTGGCFDILHLGHLALFEKSRKMGDVVFVLLESDKKIKELKGADKPFHTQKERALLLSSLRDVDYVVMLPYMNTHEQYEKVVLSIHPTFIITTEGDPKISQKKKQAHTIGAKVVSIKKKKDLSTTTIAKHIKKDL